MSTTESQRQMIVQHWFRKLIASAITIQDILKIILAYSNIFDMFDKSTSHELIKIEKDGTLIDGNLGRKSTAFGTMTASPGVKYHWQLNIIKSGSGTDNRINIGIVEADMCNNKDTWWFAKYGYSYYSPNGKIFTYGVQKHYGDTFGKGDIIDVWLDLQDSNTTLSYSKNDKDFGKAFDVTPSKEYKLAVSIYGTSQIELLSFEMLGSI